MDRDSGVATIWGVTAIAVLMLLTVFAVDLGAAEVARHRAEAAADLAALAGAAHAVDGEQTACAYSDRVVAAMHARLSSCRAAPGWTILVETRTKVALPPLVGAWATARARAGPVG
jgi:secretion/DNA translocation related TadE-like protein